MTQWKCKHCGISSPRYTNCPWMPHHQKERQPNKKWKLPKRYHGKRLVKNWLIDWLIDCLNNWLAEYWLTDWLLGLLMQLTIDWLMLACLIEWFVGWSNFSWTPDLLIDAIDWMGLDWHWTTVAYLIISSMNSVRKRWSNLSDPHFYIICAWIEWHLAHFGCEWLKSEVAGK